MAKAEGRVGPLRMPSKKDLVKAGRWDVVKLMPRAGGFPSVANSLGLLSRRRPSGYWEDLDNLDHVRSPPPASSENKRSLPCLLCHHLLVRHAGFSLTSSSFVRCLYLFGSPWLSPFPFWLSLASPLWLLVEFFVLFLFWLAFHAIVPCLFPFPVLAVFL